MGGSPEEVALVEKFKGWRDELEGIMARHVRVKAGDVPPIQVDDAPAEERGLFKD